MFTQPVCDRWFKLWIWESSLTIYFSLRLASRRPNKIASSQNRASPPASTEAKLRIHLHRRIHGFLRHQCVCVHVPSTVCSLFLSVQGKRSISLGQRRFLFEKEKGWQWLSIRKGTMYGGSVRAWECVNTARDLESCTCVSNPLVTLRVFVSVI